MVVDRQRRWVIVWNLSYGELASQQLNEWRANAASERAAAAGPHLSDPRPTGLRVMLGRGLVRLGEWLAGTAARPALR